MRSQDVTETVHADHSPLCLFPLSHDYVFLVELQVHGGCARSGNRHDLDIVECTPGEVQPEVVEAGVEAGVDQEAGGFPKSQLNPAKTRGSSWLSTRPGLVRLATQIPARRAAVVFDAVSDCPVMKRLHGWQDADAGIEGTSRSAPSAGCGETRVGG